jgi:hypothetical protein
VQAESPPGRIPQFYGTDDSGLPGSPAGLYTVAIRKSGAACNMATFNRIFTTQRLLQIIFVLSAAVIMKLLS